MLHGYIRSALVVGAAGTLYLLLLYLTVGYAFIIMPGLEWLKVALGPVSGSWIWMHSAHAAALLVSAVPAGALLSILERHRAMMLAALTGVLTAIAAFLPSLFHEGLRQHLTANFYVSGGVDSIKTVLVLMLVTWLFGKLPSNNAMQRSARVVTPLAGSGAGMDRTRSASGAPTARRR